VLLLLFRPLFDDDDDTAKTYRWLCLCGNKKRRRAEVLGGPTGGQSGGGHDHAPLFGCRRHGNHCFFFLPAPKTDGVSISKRNSEKDAKTAAVVVMTSVTERSMGVQ
jgi:hypothetical protein